MFSTIRENVYGFAGKYPALVNRKRVLLQQDNARPHKTKKTLQKIEELEGIELLPHPAFSPNFEPSDYCLFRSMAQFLCGKKF
jgi:histone-lysine N-methyltransferase SETMAR